MKFEALESMKRDIERVIDNIHRIGRNVEKDENLKEYLIEADLWNEDYIEDVNVAELVLDIIMGAKSL